MTKIHGIISILFCLILLSCGRPTIPDSFQKESRKPKVMPDYTDVTIPTNICPLNFRVYEVGKEIAVRISAGNQQYTYGNGMKVLIDEEEWQGLLQAAKGDKMTIEVFVNENGNWKAFEPFYYYVAEETIDEYISYRLIQPLYVAYGNM